LLRRAQVIPQILVRELTMVRIKICGITNKHDASLAVSLGAHALGFIFAPSPRRVNPEKMRDIIRALPPFIQTVGVFVNEDPAIMKSVIDFCGIDLVQLHGDEGPEICAMFSPRAIKAVRLKGRSSLELLEPYRGKARAVLVDTYVEGLRGGTGRTCDWEAAVEGKKMGLPIILSGGLTPSNLERAVSSVRPYGVDINSGVEERPGKKCSKRLKRIMHIVKRINSEECKDV